jgi:hypothetical protein
MRARSLASAGLSGLLLAVPAGYQSPASAPRVAATEALLARVAAFLDTYERSLPAIVAEENYTQRASVEGRLGMESRTLRSDVLVIADEDYGWISFRDVFEVDGRAVRSRDQRLVDLFLSPHGDRFAQARRIVAEGARFNLNVSGFDVHRTINMPLVALRFLRRFNQSRSLFRIAGDARVGSLLSTLLEFEEQSMPRVISSPDAAAARGRFWVEPGSGRILRSELSFETGTVDQKTPLRSRVRVSYGWDERVNEWLPLSMQEEYRVAAALIEGVASYSNFRRFTVATSADIKRDLNEHR